MERSEFFKTFGFGVAAATVAPKILFQSGKVQKDSRKVNIQPPEAYIKDFDNSQIFIYESITGDLEQGRNFNGKLYPIDPDKPYVPVETINVGNFKPQLLFNAVGNNL